MATVLTARAQSLTQRYVAESDKTADEMEVDKGANDSDKGDEEYTLQTSAAPITPFPTPAAADSTTLPPRRPTTNSTSDYWYVSQKQWDIWLGEADSGDKARKKVAMHNLRKFSKAGYLIETSLGVAAPNPAGCRWCTRSGLEVDCITERGKFPCAYYIRMSKGSCTAGIIPEESGEADGELARIDTLVAQVQKLEAQVTKLQEEMTQVQSWNYTYDKWLVWLSGEANERALDVYRLWKAVWPHAERDEPVHARWYQNDGQDPGPVSALFK